MGALKWSLLEFYSHGSGGLAAGREEEGGKNRGSGWRWGGAGGVLMWSGQWLGSGGREKGREEQREKGKREKAKERSEEK